MKHSIKNFIWVLLVQLPFNCMFLFTNKAKAQQIAFSYKGDWSSWYDVGPKGSDGWSNFNRFSNCQTFRSNDGSAFSFKTEGGIEFFLFQINNYIRPSKEQIKSHLQSKQWYEYSGYVEYYVSDQYPTAEDITKANILVIPNPRIDETPTVKRRAMATIRIAPYKKNPFCYNIFFDNVGIGFSAYGLKYGSYKLK